MFERSMNRISATPQYLVGRRCISDVHIGSHAITVPYRQPNATTDARISIETRQISTKDVQMPEDCDKRRDPVGRPNTDGFHRRHDRSSQ